MIDKSLLLDKTSILMHTGSTTKIEFLFVRGTTHSLPIIRYIRHSRTHSHFLRQRTQNILTTKTRKTIGALSVL